MEIGVLFCVNFFCFPSCSPRVECTAENGQCQVLVFLAGQKNAIGTLDTDQELRFLKRYGIYFCIFKM